MKLLSDTDKENAAADIRKMILASDQTAVLLRKIEQERLYGSDKTEFEEITTFPLEFIATSPEDLNQKIDATACVLPDLDIQSEDHIRIENEEYRVQTIGGQLLFGALTHKAIKLVKIHGR